MHKLVSYIKAGIWLIYMAILTLLFLSPIIIIVITFFDVDSGLKFMLFVMGAPVAIYGLRTASLAIENFSLNSYSNRPSMFKYLLSIKYVLPKKFREEFVGDIIEIYTEMTAAGYPKIWIYIILSLHLVTIIWAGFKMKFSEVFTGYKSISK